MVENFDPATYFTPEEYARINQPRLEREAARARAAARRAAVRGDDETTLADLRAYAAEATRTAQENHDRLTALQAESAGARPEEVQP